jgi:hypothetical protein
VKFKVLFYKLFLAKPRLFWRRPAGVMAAMNRLKAPESRAVNLQFFEILAPVFGCPPEKFLQQRNKYSVI